MSKDGITNYGKSIRSKLLLIAKKEDVFYQTVLTRYFQERLLYRMSQTRFRSNFFLKGGALMYAYERFADNPQMEVRWNAFGRKISKNTTTSFREVVAFIQETLRPYWDNLSHD